MRGVLENIGRRCVLRGVKDECNLSCSSPYLGFWRDLLPELDRCNFVAVLLRSSDSPAKMDDAWS